MCTGYELSIMEICGKTFAKSCIDFVGTCQSVSNRVQEKRVVVILQAEQEDEK